MATMTAVGPTMNGLVGAGSVAGTPDFVANAPQMNRAL